MDLQTFWQIVDSAQPGIADCEGDLRRLYDYVGLDHGSAYTDLAVSDALYARMRVCFTSGHAAVSLACKALRRDLIREHVLQGAPLDPYFEVLDHLQDAIRNGIDRQESWLRLSEQFPANDKWRSAGFRSFDGAGCWV
jgi:hypothetical protein